MSEHQIRPEAAPAQSWSRHFRETFWLGLPLVAAQFGQMALTVGNTAILSRLGPEALAAAVLGGQIFFVLWIFGCGFGFAVMPLVANAIGSGDPRGGRRFLRMGLWVSFAYAALMLIPLWKAEAILLALGQDPQVSALAAQYAGALKWSLFPQLAIICLRSFLGALGRPGIVVAAMAVGAAANLGLGLWLTFGGWGLPAFGMRGAGIATFLATSAIAIFLCVYVALRRGLRDQQVFTRFFALDLPAMGEVFRLGWPIGATVVAEVGLFTATSFMMGLIGTVELAAHGIALQLSGLAFMVPLGLASATTIRVGRSYGARAWPDLRRAAEASLILGLGFACLSALAFLTIPRTLMGLYLDVDAESSAAVAAFGASFLLVAGLFQIVDGVQSLSSGALRGMKETRVPMLIALLSYWAVGAPAAWGLAFWAGWGGVGVWWGLAIGLAAAALLMTARLAARVKGLKAHDQALASA